MGAVRSLGHLTPGIVDASVSAGWNPTVNPEGCLRSWFPCELRWLGAESAGIGHPGPALDRSQTAPETQAAGMASPPLGLC